MWRVLAVIFVLFVTTESVGAATMTFTGLSSSGGSGGPFIEDGITAQGNIFGVGSFDTVDTAHMDTGGAPFPSAITFTMDRAFHAVSFDILPLPSFLCSTASPTVCGLEHDNVVVQGFDDGGLVASDSFWMGDSANTYLFSSAFRNLTSLRISIVLPPIDDTVFCADNPCSHMNIDNVTLTAVPLPPAFLLLVSGIGVMVAARAAGKGIGRRDA